MKSEKQDKFAEFIESLGLTDKDLESADPKRIESLQKAWNTIGPDIRADMLRLRREPPTSATRPVLQIINRALLGIYHEPSDEKNTFKSANGQITYLHRQLTPEELCEIAIFPWRNWKQAVVSTLIDNNNEPLTSQEFSSLARGPMSTGKASQFNEGLRKTSFPYRLWRVPRVNGHYQSPFEGTFRFFRLGETK